MGLKTYSLRLDEDEFEKLKKALGEHGDPDLNVGYVIRSYIRDLNRAIPNLKKSMFGLRNNISLFGSMLKEVDRLIELEMVIKGRGNIIRQQIAAEK